MNVKNKIAVVGIACKFPGAENVDEFWKVLIEGRDTITHFTDEELEKYEIDFENLRKNPDYVGAKGVLSDIDKFDPAFFGYTPKEAEVLDPQYRIWLETVWNALENAGCDPFSYKGKIGVFAGGSMNTYLLNNILRNPRIYEDFIRMRSPESFQVMIGNDVAFLPTKTAYKLNLRGPAINVQSACSTSLVAVSLACNSLISGESDMAIAGGVTIIVPQETGYIYQEGAIPSPDGVCRSFDKDAKGTVFSNGVGVVVLKRLDEALRDGDIIYSVVNGWALNNDGNSKVSYVAPSIDGQADVIKSAQALAGVSPEDIGYIEAHGTATLLGDPVELTALSNAFKAGTNKKQYCGIGSVKSNMGHSDVAAGIAGFIKASLSVYNHIIPRTIHYSEPNPYFDFNDSPFYVQDKQKVWSESKPLMIGISSFGIGGTNAHVIIEEPPQRRVPDLKPSELPDLLILSAKSEKSLESKKQNILDFIKSNPDLNIRDIAYSLVNGRARMKFRSFVSVSDSGSITSDKVRFTDGKADDFISKTAFCFPGQGAQYLSMGNSLYRSNVFFRRILDECFSVYKNETGEDIKEIIFSSDENKNANVRLADTEITQPALFIIEYALAKLFIHLEVIPSYLIGHSIGEYTAACLAGVFDLETALKIVIMRGRLMQKMPGGKMMAVRTDKTRLESIKSGLFEIAAENALQACTISMKPANVSKVESLLKEHEVQYIELNTSHAFHSSDFDPILDEFSDYVSQFKLCSPQIPFISCLTGEFITDLQATSGKYWAKQLRNTVMFNKGISSITGVDDVAFLEVGPNTHLSSLIKQNESVGNKSAVISSLGKTEDIDEIIKVINAIGRLFNIGISVNFTPLFEEYKPVKICLPTYPFEKRRCWIDFQLTNANYSDVPSFSSLRQSADSISDDKTDFSELTPSEKNKVRITNLWKSIFGLDEIGAEDNFFDLGGHSLLALQILARVKDEFSQSISLKEFLENPTISQLCSAIEKNKVNTDNKKDKSTAVDLTNLPLSLIQKRIWILSQLDPLIPTYNISFTYKFLGELNIEIFQKSINLLFERHFLIHSVFKKRNGEPYCEIVQKPVDLGQIDLTGLSKEESVQKFHSFVSEESRQPFNLEVGPLYRLFLFKHDQETYFFHASVHHLVFDGWSWSVFIMDLKRIYEGLLENKVPEAEDVKDFYFEYFSLLQDNPALQNDEESERFWIENMKGCPPEMNFPYDFKRKEAPSGYGEKECVSIPSDVTLKLKEISRKENVTLFTTMMAATAVLFNKYSGDNSICIGTHVANRVRPDFERIFGMFVNTIPVRFNIDGTTIFNDLIGHTRNILLDAISHQDTPFDKIVEAVNPVRSLNFNPLFQVSIVWLSYSAIDLELKGVKAERVFVREGISPFDITLYLWDTGDTIEGEIEFNIDILKPDTMVRFKDNFIHLVQAIAEKPDQKISELSVLSESDRKSLDSFNNTESPVPDCLINELFENQAKQKPNAIALISGGTSLTYKELDIWSNQLAAYLISLGVKKGDIVGIHIERSVEMVVSVLGVLKAGCCYLPLDPSFPQDRLKYMLEDSGARVIISQSTLAEKSKEFMVQSLVLIDSDKKKITSFKTGKPVVEIDSDYPAYIIYTSGSTGKPKGVPVSHYSVVNMVTSMSVTPGISDRDRLLAVVTLSFDMSVYELFVTLSNGATLVVAGSKEVTNGHALIDLIDNQKISVIQATPSFWHLLISSGWKGRKTIKALCGGEALTPNLVRQVLPLVGEFWNCYGPTETTVYSTCTRVTDANERIHIGKPLKNTRIYILDKSNSIVPVGVVGEVCIGGAGVSKGYRNRPDLTSGKFIRLGNESIYKTGDLGRFLDDGNIELLGRADNQIKLRGFRIEPGEIESLLSDLPHINEAVVKIHRFEDNDDRLVAFIAVDSLFNLTKENLTESLSHNLPPYMIPSFFQEYSDFPRLPNGKVNKEALIFNGMNLINNDFKEKELFTPTEEVIYKIWMEALKTDDISLTDNFFGIGGNSLLAINVFSKIESAFDMDLNLRLFFDSPRIKDLSESIDMIRSKSSKDEAAKEDSEKKTSRLSYGEI